MGLVGWLEIIKAALYFPEAMLRLVAALQKTPQEMHEALLQASEAEAQKLKSTGRPSWD